MSLIGGGSDDSGVPTRKTHIHRIYKDDDPDSGIWVDIERIDEITYTSGVGFAQQEKVWIFNWADFNPDGDGVTKKKIKDPNDSSTSGNGGSDGSDGSADSSASVILVPVRDKIEVSQGSNNQYQSYIHFFGNDSTNTSRNTHSRRVYHYDVPDDQLDENKNPPRNPQDYLNALGDKDDSQYLEVEILDSFTTTENESRDSHGQIKPSVSQEKIWLVNNTGVLLSDRDGDTSKDFATKNPADGIIDPPWRLDPLQNIVNVGLGSQYRIVLFRGGFRGAPQTIMQFTTPKTFFTGNEKVPAPVFGSTINIPTTSGPILAPSGGAPDYRGYTTVRVLESSDSGPVDSGERVYFNYKGEEINKIPLLSDIENNKGLALASDTDGTVYVKGFARNPGSPETWRYGITKYDKDGGILWTTNDTPELGLNAPYPLCANYDPQTKLITFVLSDWTTNVWDLDGGGQTLLLPHGYSLQDVTRKGKIYTTRVDDSGNLTLAAFSPTLDLLWEVPPASGFNVAALTAYGEDWVLSEEIGNGKETVIGTFEVGPGNPNTGEQVTSDVALGPGYILISLDITISSDTQMGVYNGKDGSSAGLEFWAKAFAESTTTSGNPQHANDYTQQSGSTESNQTSYSVLGFGRSAYFP